MNQMPLHPALVHLPLGLALIIPVTTIAFAAVLWSGKVTRWLWAVLIVFQLGMVGSTWLAMETGEKEEDRVEAIVPKQALEAHEHAAKILLGAAGVTLLTMSVAAMLPTLAAFRIGTVVSLVTALAVTYLALGVGHSGGELIYVHGAASAYASGATPSTAPAAQARGDHHEGH